MTTAPTRTCVLCRIVTDSASGAWYDTELYRYGNFSVIPGLGAQAPGYLMIVPRTHVLSSAALSDADLRDLLQVISSVSRVLRDQYGDALFFEHGACSESQRAGGCISHAHVHAVGTDAPLAPVAHRRLSYEHIADLGELRGWAHRPYVAIRDQEGSCTVASAQGLPGQYLRRLLDEALGEVGEWDYSLFPHLDRIRETIRDLRPRFAEIMRSGNSGRAFASST